jgi:hypothetical protein
MMGKGMREGATTPQDAHFLVVSINHTGRKRGLQEDAMTRFGLAVAAAITAFLSFAPMTASAAAIPAGASAEVARAAQPAVQKAQYYYGRRYYRRPYYRPYRPYYRPYYYGGPRVVCRTVYSYYGPRRVCTRRW